MKFDHILSLLLLGASAANAVAMPEPANILDPTKKELGKRKGGGGGGARGGGGGGGRSGSGSSSSSGSSSGRGGSSSSGSSSSSGGSSSKGSGGSSSGSSGSGSSSSSSSSSSRSGQGSSSSSGSSRGGSGSSSSSGARAGAGAPRSFAGGKYYGGGAAAPYKAGNRSPSGITPFLFVGAAALAFWPGLWLYGAYSYPYTHPYRFHNSTRDEEEELPVICACDPNSACGCDENQDSAYLSDLVGDGSYNGLNHSLITVAEVNGTKTILINGTLSSDTEAPSDGNDDNDNDNESAAIARAVEALGYWPMVAAALAAVFVG